MGGLTLTNSRMISPLHSSCRDYRNAHVKKPNCPNAGLVNSVLQFDGSQRET